MFRLDSCRQNPKGDGLRTFLEAGVESGSSRFQALFLQLDLPHHHPQFVEVRVQLRRRREQLQGRGQLACRNSIGHRGKADIRFTMTRSRAGRWGWG